MSWTDVVNTVPVNHSDDARKPVKVPRGVWFEDVFINQRFDSLVETRSGPVFSIEDNRAVYTYTVTDRPDIVELYRDHVLIRIYNEQITRENAGTDVNGLKVETDDGALAKIMGALDQSRGGGPHSTRKFNGKHGRAVLDVQAMEDVATAIREHKQTVNDWAYDQSILVVDNSVTTVAQIKTIEAAIDFTND